MEVPPERRIGEWIDGRLEIKEIIGAGSYAVVYLAECQVTHKKYGIKCFHKSFRNREQLLHQREEIEINKILRQGGHPNVVHMVKGIETEACFFLIMEYCDQPDMFDLIKRDNGFDMLAIRDLFPQLLSAVEFCHKNSVYHRDLKPENVLVSGCRSIKLTDFGLATTVAHPQDLGCGSLPYMAPEVLEGKGVKSYAAGPADIWALGVILFNMVYAQSIWQVADEKRDPSFAAFKENPLNLQRSFYMSKPFYDLLRRMFELDPTKRCGFDEIRRMFYDIHYFCLGPDEGFDATPERTIRYHEHPDDSVLNNDGCTTWSVTDHTEVNSPQSAGSLESLPDHDSRFSLSAVKETSDSTTSIQVKNARRSSIAKSQNSLLNFLVRRPAPRWGDSNQSSVDGYMNFSSKAASNEQILHPSRSGSCLSTANGNQHNVSCRTDAQAS